MPLDPVTAVFNFLCTPAGQVLANVADDAFKAIIHDLIVLVHSKNVPK